MTQERIEALKEHYEKKGWSHDDKSLLLSFVSPCGRWFECWDRETSQFYCMDGDWVVNLRKGEKNEIGTV